MKALLFLMLTSISLSAFADGSCTSVYPEHEQVCAGYSDSEQLCTSEYMVNKCQWVDPSQGYCTGYHTSTGGMCSVLPIQTACENAGCQWVAPQ